MIDFESKMRQACSEINKWALKYAELKPMVDFLEDKKKSLYHSEMVKAGNVPMWKAECYASSSEVYFKHLEAIRDVKIESLTAKAMFDTATANLDALRSLCSLQKTQMSAFQE